ncbi:MAG TPA: Uma2 family endonuclease [Longimicrobium sp.]|nr:Uma2 family endonuclease [Longimicrobium sp.]
MTTETKRITAHELYWHHQETCTRRELVRGVIHDRPLAGWRQSDVTMNAMRLLGGFIRAEKLGVFVGPRTGFWVERDPDSVLAPTFAFVRAGRYPRPVKYEDDFYFPGPPDLAGESVSDLDPPGEVQARVDRWLQAGARMILLIHIDHQTVSVYRPGAPPTVLTGNDALDGADVVPGWTVPVCDLFDR